MKKIKKILTSSALIINILGISVGIYSNANAANSNFYQTDR